MKKNYAKQFDIFLAQQVAKIESLSEYQRFQEFLSSLNEKEKKIVSETIHLGMVLIPLLILIPIWLSNWSLKSGINEKKALIRTYEQYVKSKESLEFSGQDIYASGRIDSEQDALVKLKSYMQRLNIDPNKISVVDFRPGTISENLKETHMQVKFQGLALSEFADFLSSLINTEKFKIAGLRIEKDQANSLLQGHISLNHFARNQ